MSHKRKEDFLPGQQCLQSKKEGRYDVQVIPTQQEGEVEILVGIRKNRAERTETPPLQ